MIFKNRLKGLKRRIKKFKNSTILKLIEHIKLNNFQLRGILIDGIVYLFEWLEVLFYIYY